MSNTSGHSIQGERVSLAEAWASVGLAYAEAFMLVRELQ